jgi:hypothetical protein
MEHLFSPCIRLYNRLENRGRLGDRYPFLQELNLNVSTGELLRAERAFTYADLYAMVGNTNTVAWLTPHVAVVRNHGEAMQGWNQLAEECRFYFIADGNEIIAVALSSEHLLEICDVVFRLLAMSVVTSVCLYSPSLPYHTSINARSLAYLMEHCQSLKVLTLVNLEIDEDYCRVLGAYSRPGLDIELQHCNFTSAGESALAEVLGRKQGPTKLNSCEIDNLVLANGLRGNSSLKSFSEDTDAGNGNQEFLAVAGVLKENKGLVELNLRSGRVSNDTTWGAICDSLETHPTLEEVLGLRSTFAYDAISPAVRKSKMQALLDVMKVNMSIHTIHLRSHYSQHDIFRESVIPYLETNRLRPRLLAIQRTRPILYRAKVLGRALLSARNDANSFWMLLSGNAEVVFPSRTATITAAAILPTPAAAAATSIANNAAVAASVMPDLTTTAAGTLLVAAPAITTSAATPSTASDDFAFAPAAAANVAAPSAGQKRKTRP